MKRIKKLLSTLSAAVIGLSAMTSVASADPLYYDDAPVDDFYYYTVRLADEPLAKYDYALKNGVDKFIFTDEGKAVYENLMSDHDSVLQTISTMLGREVERVYDYTSVFNGFTVVLRKSEYCQICDDPQSFNVDRIELTGDYTESSKTAKPENKTNTELSYSDITDKILEQTGVSKVDEKGDSTVIAIIDCEFELEHEFLSSMPEEAICTVSEEDVNNVSPYLSSACVGGSGYYYNEKIPYRFDYEKRNTDTSISETESYHGTHVAGIAGGNGAAETDPEYDPEGVAPNAQLMLFSIGESYAIPAYCGLAAYNDCAYLGADIVNASYGATMAQYDFLEKESIDNLTATGVMFCTIPQNYSKYPFYGADSVLNTDYSTGGSPGSFASTFSVASADNTVTEIAAVTVGGKNYKYCSGTINILETFAGTEKELVVVPGYGYPEDYTGLDVNGKVVLVQRGEISFNDKAQNAKDNGAVGIVFYNNEPGELTPYCDTLPSGAISQESGLSIIESGASTILFNSEPKFSAESKNKISSYSGWGFTDELVLKPDITAFGGNIISSALGNKYGYMSGTSMAAPQMTGICALLKEYLKKNADKYGIVNSTDYPELMAKLLMSTANPIYYDDGLETASPRVQGSGLVNVEKAMNTPAYLYTESQKDACRPKLSLGDNFEKNIGSESFSKEKFFFHIKNISDVPQTYSLSGELFRDDCIIDEETGEAALANGITSMPESKVIFRDESMSETDKVTVGAGEDVVVYLDVRLGTGDCQYIENYFKNGTFIDGYVHLTSDTAPDLNLPFMGYYGKWSKSDIFEPFVYQNPDYSFPTVMADSNYNVSGLNKLADFNEESVMESLPAYSPNGDNIMDNIMISLGLKRHCKNVSAEIYNNTGRRVYTEKCSLDNASGLVDAYGERLRFDFTVNWDFEGAADGEIYTIKISAETPLMSTGSRREVISQQFIIDTKAPEITECKKIQTPYGEKLMLKVTDNNALQGAVVYDSTSEEIFGYDYCTKPDTKECTLTIDLPENSTGMKATLYDMAGNSVTINTDDAATAYNLAYEENMFFSTNDRNFKEKISVTDSDGNELNFTTVPESPEEAYENRLTEVTVMCGEDAVAVIPVTVGQAGDADYNEKVNILDAITVSKYVLWKNNPNGSYKTLFENYDGSFKAYLADYDRNGKIDLVDAISILKLIMPSKK